MLRHAKKIKSNNEPENGLKNDFAKSRMEFILAGRPKKDKKRQKSIKKVSKKREIENIIYFREREQFLKDNKACQLKTPVCTKTATVIHHVNGRAIYFLDKETWMPSCRKCNNWVEENDAEARKMGLKKSKFSK